jgi:hypothetical protein
MGIEPNQNSATAAAAAAAAADLSLRTTYERFSFPVIIFVCRDLFFFKVRRMKTQH